MTVPIPVGGAAYQTRQTRKEIDMPAALPHYPELPLALPEVSQLIVDLCGAWAYQQPVRDRFAQVPLEAEATLTVPGEVVMQGLAYDPTTGIALEREVTVPSDWSGQVIRLRFEAVYSTCSLWIDGQPVAQHLGGFTPFDVDITAFARPAEALRLTLHLENNSIADLIAFGTRYADHPLIGIPRKAFVYSLPQAHILGLGVATVFEDGDYDTAQLRLDLKVSGPSDLSVTLVDPEGVAAPLGSVKVDGIGVAEFTIANPKLWDTETPSLYALQLELAGAQYSRKVGFREFCVKDRRPHLNGKPIMLRGVNHHEVHPLTGRADTARWAETDVRLFREGNVNFLRTSHYPPTIELAEACDAAGMLLEVEAPVCFAFGQFDYMREWDKLSAQEQETTSDYIEAASLEMIAFYRSHPSVVIWSVANESYWAPPFARASEAIRAADPTRPQTYNWWRLEEDCRDFVEIANHHYPDAGKVSEFAIEPRPILFDEFAHLYCYSDRELATDPGLRQHWGKFLARQWEEIVALPNGAGGSIWAAIDDWFAVPQPGGGIQWRGYGEWGPIDGWRRKKPEFEGMKRAFDPLQVSMAQAEAGKAIEVTIQNRFDVADLAEIEFSWRLDDRSGREQATGRPGTKALFRLPVPEADERLELVARLPRLGYERVFSHQGDMAPNEVEDTAAPAMTADGSQLKTVGWTITPNAEGFALAHFDGFKGAVSLALIPRHFSRRQGVKSTEDLVPLSSVSGAWSHGQTSVENARGILSGKYERAKGQFALSSRADGSLSLSYDFEMLDDFEPFQFGLEIVTGAALETLDWHSDRACDLDPTHPARTTGRAPAWRDKAIGPDQQRATEPDWPWARDQTGFGTHDFCSTKLDVQRAGLRAANGRGLGVSNRAGMDIRAQSQPDATHLFVLGFSSPGSEFFHRSFVEHRDLRAGDHVAGSFVLTAIDQPEGTT